MSGEIEKQAAGELEKPAKKRSYERLYDLPLGDGAVARCFVMGGATSTDRMWRTEGVSWWAREMPSDEEYEEALRNLEEVNFKVDIVITHCAPEGYIGNHLAGKVIRSRNRLTEFFDSLITEHGLEFNHWYFGHYHRDLDWDRFSLMFSRILPLI